MKMQAYRIVEWGRPAEFVDVDVPSPGPGEVLIRMRGAGLCRTDLDLMDAVPGTEPYTNVLSAGFTLGHENAGIVEALGSGVTDLAEGTAVVVHHIHCCRHCEFCVRGIEQHCTTFARGAMSLTRGLGLDGGLAPWMVVPSHELVAIGALDPVDFTPLTDAGVTAFHAVRKGLRDMPPDATALVIGIGGLGAYAVQFLKLLGCGAIIGVDTQAERLASAAALGADHGVAFGPAAAGTILDLTANRGADVILDLVGTAETLALAARVSRPHGRIVIVGIGGGALPVGWGAPATSCETVVSMGSTRQDLVDVCTLAAEGKLQMDREIFAFDEVEAAYARLREGRLSGRAVVRFPA